MTSTNYIAEKDLSDNQVKLINNHLRTDMLLFGVFLLSTQLILVYFNPESYQVDIPICFLVVASFYLALQKRLLKTFVLVRNVLIALMFYIIYVSLNSPMIAFEYLFTISIAIGILIFERNHTNTKILFVTIFSIGMFLLYREITQPDKDQIVFDSPINLSILFFFIIDIVRRIWFLFQYQGLINEEHSKVAEKYESIFKNSLMGFATADINRNIIDANDAFCDMLGYTRDQLVQMKIEDIYTQESLKDVKPWVEQLRRGEFESYEHQSDFLTRAGEVLSTHIYVKGVFKNGSFSKSIVAAKDISERLLFEKKLKKSEMRMRSIFEDTACGLALLRNGQFITCNQAFLDIFQINKDEISSMTIFNSITQFDHGLKEEIKSKFSLGLNNFSFKTKIEVDGSFKYIQAFIKIRYEETGAKRVSLLSVLDISQLVSSQKQAEARNRIINAQFSELHLQKIELEKYLESNTQLENFASIAAHDIKSPLRTIGSFAQLLKMSVRDVLDENQLSYLERIIKSSSDLHKLTEDILQFSRTDSVKVNVERIDVEDFISQNLLSLQSALDESQAQIKLENLPKFILADRVKISQVMQNLIRNAIKFRKEEEVPTVTISSKENDDYWTFCITDNGIGIKNEFQEQVFGIFNKLHKSTKFEGSGLGLAIVKKIVEQHNGRVWVESEYGIGSSFFFTLCKKAIIFRSIEDHSPNTPVFGSN